MEIDDVEEETVPKMNKRVDGKDAADASSTSVTEVTSKQRKLGKLDWSKLSLRNDQVGRASSSKKPTKEVPQGDNFVKVSPDFLTDKHSQHALRWESARDIVVSLSPEKLRTIVPKLEESGLVATMIGNYMDGKRRDMMIACLSSIIGRKYTQPLGIANRWVIMPVLSQVEREMILSNQEVALYIVKTEKQMIIFRRLNVTIDVDAADPINWGNCTWGAVRLTGVIGSTWEIYKRANDAQLMKIGRAIESKHDGAPKLVDKVIFKPMALHVHAAKSVGMILGFKTEAPFPLNYQNVADIVNGIESLETRKLEVRAPPSCFYCSSQTHFGSDCEVLIRNDELWQSLSGTTTKLYHQRLGVCWPATGRFKLEHENLWDGRVVRLETAPSNDDASSIRTSSTPFETEPEGVPKSKKSKPNQVKKAKLKPTLN